jgi:hypothetical protein
MKKRASRTWMLFGVVAAAAVGAVAGYAYFTATGTGAGSATVGSDTPLTITGGSVAGLTPGAPGKQVSFSIANAAANGSQNLGKVSISSIVVSKAVGAVGSCTASDFSVSDGSAAVGTIGPGATYSSDSTTEPTIAMIESGSNQDGCKSASLSFTLSAGQGS